ncbi:MAG: DUF1622 domain-containing protein [Fimbriimonas sp.]
MLDYVEEATRILAICVEAGAAFIVMVAAIQALWRVILLLTKGDDEHAKESIRLSFGRWLALALEFMLAGDILRTTIAPTWDEIGQLAAIVILRTVLNFFLQMEIDRADKAPGEGTSAPQPS